MNTRQFLTLMPAVLAALIISCGPKPVATNGANTGGTRSGGEALSAGNTEGTPNQGYEDRPGTVAGAEGAVTHGAVGSVVTRTIGDIPENWPEDIPIMEGFSVVNGQESSQGMMAILLTGAVPVDDVFKFYSSLEGWQKDPNVPWVVDGPNRTIKLVRSLENLSVNIYENQGKTQLSLTYYTIPTHSNSAG
jgi:hypothetical protein